MSKFSGSKTRPVRANLHAPVRTTPGAIPTFEGGSAFGRDIESDLFLLAVTNMVGEDTFYETASTRDARFVDLVHKVAASNPEFIAGTLHPVEGVEPRDGFTKYLRSTMLMRSASAVMAAEYIAAGGPRGRLVVNNALQRPDEPAEILGYWMGKYGRRMPIALKRGVADAVRRLYTERSALRYDGGSRQIRMGDVIDLVHPRPRGNWQSTLFRYLLTKRHHPDSATIDPEILPTLSAAARLDKMSGDELRSFVKENGFEALSDAGYSWERLSGKTKMDAEAWGMILGSMGVMALVRNLRNFDQAGISEEAVDAVIGRITDPIEVAKARLFPFQTWTAYREAPSDNWRRALGKTLDLTTQNIPDLDGTLVVIDTSSSMKGTVSGRSTVRRVEVAALMAAATARRASNVDVVIFGQSHAKIQFRDGLSTLSQVEQIVRSVGSVGHATYGHTAIRAHFSPQKHKRVILFTDDQMHDSGSVRLDDVPLIYTFNLAGYRASSLASGEKGRFTLGGFSDGTFTMMSVLEAGRDADWPF